MTTPRPELRESALPTPAAVWPGLWPLLLANLGLLFLQIGHQSLWLDEMTSLAVASGPVERAMVFFSQHREQHPVYYVLLRLWLVLGTSEVVLRGFSALAAAATTALMYFAGRRLVGENPARLATCLAAFAPFLLYYGQEGRMYCLLMAESLWLTHLFAGWWRAPSSRRALVYWTVGTLTVYTHLAGAFVVVAHGVWALMARERRGRLGPTLALCGAVGVAYLPWLVFLLGHPSPEQEWKSWVHVAFGAPYTLLRWSLGYSVVLANAGWKERVPELIRENAPVLAVAAVGYGCVFLMGLRRLLRQAREEAGLVLVLLGVPVLLATLASPVAVLLSERYLSVSFPAFLLLLSVGLRQVLEGVGLKRWIAPVLLSGAVAFALWRYYTDPRFGRAEWRDVARFVEADAKLGDAVLLHTSAIEPVFRHYGRNLPPAVSTSAVGAVDSVRSAPRVWVVVSHATDGGLPILAALARTHVVELDTLFTKEVGIRVLRMAR